MDAVPLSNRALLTEVIPMARSGGEEGEEEGPLWRRHTHS